MNRVYLDTARLLTQVAPVVFASRRFALKGGTAINLFERDMPRLSVDLDLVFIDHRMEREAALAIIEQDLRSAAVLLGKRGFQTRAAAAADTSETKLFVERDGIQVKVEVNHVMRGTLHPVRQASLAAGPGRRSWPTWNCPSCRWKTSTAESSWPQWTGSTRATCST